MIQLKERLEEHVIEFYERSRDTEIRQMFPMTDLSVEASIELYKASKGPDSTSYGMVIYEDDRYIGDIWVYAIEDEMAMLSIVIFDKAYWGKGIGPEVIKDFCDSVFGKVSITKIGAFTYENNKRSRRALMKSGFVEIEKFEEDARMSVYYEYQR